VDFVDTAGAETGAGTAEGQVTALYQAHALSLARLALVMLGDAAAAEDVVQDAFLGLYRRWASLDEWGSAEAPSSRQRHGRSPLLAGCSGRGHEHLDGRPRSRRHPGAGGAAA
jgi:hypothetical protein